MYSDNSLTYHNRSIVKRMSNDSVGCQKDREHAAANIKGMYRYNRDVGDVCLDEVDIYVSL